MASNSGAMWNIILFLQALPAYSDFVEALDPGSTLLSPRDSSCDNKAFPDLYCRPPSTCYFNQQGIPQCCPAGQDCGQWWVAPPTLTSTPLSPADPQPSRSVLDCDSGYGSNCNSANFNNNVFPSRGVVTHRGYSPVIRALILALLCLAF
ncbi:hypothetical protein CIRG_04962 [Coccidioides immitis RMSCC 2394]|uniref:Uncharacterized protein n=1 Tax=Coccidioides immitis RMSCC 2394 TaxID=404692 RepID=A0A0J6Y9E9_COCIT|nr:hypothetical protein CIRG_04962 [Coccidioides immitis RMSCC 2394]